MDRYTALKPSDVKNENKGAILRYFYETGVMSITDVCQALGMSRPTATLIVQELVQEKFLSDAGTGASTIQGGKRPQLYDFNPRAGGVIAVYIGLDTIRGALLDLKGSVSLRLEKQAQKLGMDELLNEVAGLVHDLIEQSKKEKTVMFGIGVSAPGVIESKKGILVNATHLYGLSDVPVGPHLQSKFRMPVWVDNESRNMALAEKWFGIGQSAGSFITVQTKGGLGTGIFINGEVYQGKDNSGGEFGHTSINFEGPSCRCGNRGCWELYASESSFLTQYKQGLDQHNSNFDLEGILTFSMIGELYHQGDYYTIAQVKQYAKYLGIGIINLVNVFNPEMIILRGDLMALGAPFLKEINIFVKQQALSPASQRVQIVYSEFSEDTKIIGAGTLVIKEVIEGHLISKLGN